MLKEILIKIGSITIIIVRKIFDKNDNNKYSKSIENQTTDELIKINKKKRKKIKYNTLLLIPTILLIIFICSRNIKITLEISVLAGIIILFKRNIPRIKEENRKNEINQKLHYALRQMSTQLKAGIGLYDTMRIISESNYGSLSDEFNITLTEIQYGTTYTEAFEKLSKRVKLKSMDKVISQIIRTLNNGGNLADTLNTLADENSYNMKLKYKEYSEKLNAIMLLYMFIAVLLPVISFIMIIAATTVIGSIVQPELLILIYLVFFPMIIVFMIMFIKRLEPQLS